MGLGGKLPLQLLLVFNPVFHLVGLNGQHASHDIDDAEEVAGPDVDILDILVPWEHHATVTVFHEVHASDTISLEINIIFLLDDLWFQ